MEKKPNDLPRYLRNPDVVLREEDPDGVLIFNPDTDQIRVLNATGSFIWQLCDGSKDKAGIISAVRQSFDAVPDDQVLQQVEKFIDEMVDAGFIGILEK